MGSTRGRRRGGARRCISLSDPGGDLSQPQEAGVAAMRWPERVTRFPCPHTGLPLSSVLLAALCGFAVAPKPSGCQVIGPAEQVSVMPEVENQPDVAVSGSVALAVWMTSQGTCGSGSEWAISTDGGYTWGQSGALPGEIYGGGQPSICANSSGGFYVA